MEVIVEIPPPLATGTAQIRKKRRLTDDDWKAVFVARCSSKQGKPVSKAEMALIEAALKADEKRYGNMERDVFNATVPYGSNVRR
jgi:CO/xanthine dehydrogenase FAD-binding subunit